MDQPHWLVSCLRNGADGRGGASSPAAARKRAGDPRMDVRQLYSEPWGLSVWEDLTGYHSAEWTDAATRWAETYEVPS
jgi:hypothetical protein